MTSKDLAASENALVFIDTDCISATATHGAAVATREQELAAIAQAQQKFEETSESAIDASYSFEQISSRSTFSEEEEKWRASEAQSTIMKSIFVASLSVEAAEYMKT